MGFLGSIAGDLIGAAGGLLGGILGNDSQEDQQQANHEFAWKTNTHNMLEDMSGGKYGEYLKNVAFRTPDEQAEQARRNMAIMFPHLNPWELAGSSASGVAGSMGSDANATVSKNAQATSQQMQSAMQANTQLQTANIQAKTQLLGKAIDAGVSMANTKANNETSRLNTTDTLVPQMELLESNKAKLAADIEQTLSNTDLTKQRAQTEIINTVNANLTSAGIQLNAQQLSLLNQKLGKEISLLDTAKSPVGKVAHDVSTITTEILSRGVDSAGEGFSNISDSIKSGWNSIFNTPPNQPPTRSSNPKRKRTHGGSTADVPPSGYPLTQQ